MSLGVCVYICIYICVCGWAKRFVKLWIYFELNWILYEHWPQPTAGNWQLSADEIRRKAVPAT